MARSVNYHFNIITQAVANDPVLSTRLTSPSATAIWRLMAYCVAFVAYGYEVFVDQAKAFIELLVNNRATGTEEWIVAESYKFQYGDSLQIINGVINYIDTTSPSAQAKRIIKRAAFSEDTPNVYFLKVAKENAAGNPLPLATLELQAFIAYWKRKKYPGVNFQIISKFPDKLKANLTIYRDPQVLDAVLTPLIENAIKNYLSAIPFNGDFLVNRFIDAIQAVEGVQDIAVVGSLYVRFNNGPLETNYSAWHYILRKWRTHAGYIVLDEIVITYLNPEQP